MNILANDKIQTGNVMPWWDNSYKSFPYRYLPLTNTWDEERWIREGYGGCNLNGSTYNNVDMNNTFSESTEEFLNFFSWHNQGIVYYKMNTMDALPLHSDHYTNYKKVFNVQNVQSIWRGIFFLEDWKSGHYFEIDGKPLMPWKSGDWVAWQYNVPHFAANFGTEPRYTVQITGTKND